MKGVMYARYSSDNQREESIEGQIRECRAEVSRQFNHDACGKVVSVNCSI